ncbi:hypothetical protein P3T27_006840 [Kitasatospora sp. MAA19]|uniref:hypothetical protein n=1 Tax=Kitasatospora sp. MAA19 TaxID=3035090 RepID=UPI002475E90E|nr:hypothetical protein [Kitasatospora sp. MAA19]MDH6710091.1 hypothetical protein [Kitasatospora sp. MAA19]
MELLEPCLPRRGVLDPATLRRLGVVDDYVGRQLERARGRAIGMPDDRAGPFAGGWPGWEPDPSWPLPTLPPGADEAATSATPYRL